MPKLTYAENPVHPVVNDYPAALIPTSLVFDTLHLVTRRPTFKNASFFSLLLAFLTGGVAAYTGFSDYREIPEGSDAKRMANAHALLNVGVLGAVGLGLVLRVTGRIGPLARMLNLGANAALVAASWYGTHLVYRHGMRVRGVDPLEAAPQAMPDTGKPFADQLERFAAAMPATDLSPLAFQAGEMATIASRQAQAALDTAAQEVAPRVEEVRSQVAERMDEVRSQVAARTGQVDEGGDAETMDEPIDVAATSRAIEGET